MSAHHFYKRPTDHDWRTVGKSGQRQRCHHCSCIRSRTPNGNWVYCRIGGDEERSDPGCHPLPGAIGVPFVDGELP